MKRSTLRSFGIAFFIMGLFLTFTDSTSSDRTTEAQYKEKIAALEQQLNDANDTISELQQKEPAQPTAETSATKAPEENNTDLKASASESKSSNEEIVTDTLYIYSGLTPAEVAQKLKDMRIINNSVEMELFLAQPEYATTIQKGQFELNSSMSIEEIADTITGK
ncbi:hypothetical protein D1B33_06415 [Lysinibacillus yapensis]|uniref:Endolytic transglycosylase MltG n=1 Tax=Ureibacillus yapensis TaxID=2304605 RepID=A0A396SAX7_9BACL|nr:hypothetical protein [Lysinibacillus yapensis]RHW38508.1 hypothetical protein D1B33_06415 [Lysinibacillus yapensis]